MYVKVILHQFWVKNIFPRKFNLEYGGTFNKLFMHYCGDWLTFDCFVPMIADHNLVKKSFGLMIADHDPVFEIRLSNLLARKLQN